MIQLSAHLICRPRGVPTEGRYAEWILVNPLVSYERSEIRPIKVMHFGVSRHLNSHRGFSLVELITVLVIAGVLAGVVGSRLMPSALLQLQAGRDQLISALSVAQQKAMAQGSSVLLMTSGNTIDIRVDTDGDGNFSSGESISYAGTRYPLTIAGGVTLSSGTITYDRRGYAAPTTIAVSKNSHTVNVTVTGTGYAY